MAVLDGLKVSSVLEGALHQLLLHPRVLILSMEGVGLLVSGVEPVGVVVSLMEEVDHPCPVAACAWLASGLQHVASTAAGAVVHRVEDLALAATALRDELLDVALALPASSAISARDMSVRVATCVTEELPAVQLLG